MITGILLDKSDKSNSGIMQSLMRSAMLPNNFNQIDLLDPTQSEFYYSEHKIYEKGNVIFIKDNRFDNDESFITGDMAWFRCNVKTGPEPFNRKKWTKLSLFDFVSGGESTTTITQVSIPDRTDFVKEKIEKFAEEHELNGTLYKLNVCNLESKIELPLNYNLFDKREFTDIDLTTFNKILFYFDCYFVNSIRERTFIDPDVELILNFGLEVNPESNDYTVDRELTENELINRTVIKMPLSKLNKFIIDNNYIVLEYPKLCIESLKILNTKNITAEKDIAIVIELYAFTIN